MAKKPIGVRRNNKSDSMRVDGPPTKEAKAVVHWIRNNVPVKKTRFMHSHVVDYFIGSKAVDALVNDSPWSAAKLDASVEADNANSKGDQATKIRFATRNDVVLFMDEMLKHKFFHRADKITVTKPVSSSASKSAAADGKATADSGDAATSSSTTSMVTRRRKAAEAAAATTEGDEAANKTEPAAGKTKRKVRLEMHLEQEFLDSSDAYVWIYSPMPWYYWLFGSLIVGGLIVVCLFPLWPVKMRIGVHYLSLAGVGFMGCILALGAFKYTVFAILYGLSGGRLSFWPLPNLTEDVGFLESFWPLYDYTYTVDGSGKTKKRRGKRKKQDDDDNDSGDIKKDDECDNQQDVANIVVSENDDDEEAEILDDADKAT